MILCNKLLTVASILHYNEAEWEPLGQDTSPTLSRRTSGRASGAGAAAHGPAEPLSCSRSRPGPHPLPSAAPKAGAGHCGAAAAWGVVGAARPGSTRADPSCGALSDPAADRVEPSVPPKPLSRCRRSPPERPRHPAELSGAGPGGAHGRC